MRRSCCSVEGEERSKSCARTLTTARSLVRRRSLTRAPIPKSPVGDARLRTRLRAIVRVLAQDFDNSSPSTEQHERFIHGDACQPSREPRLFLKPVEVKEGFVETFLRHIFRILPVIGYPLLHGENSLLVTKNQFFESLSVSALCGSHQRAVGVLP